MNNTERIGDVVKERDVCLFWDVALDIGDASFREDIGWRALGELGDQVAGAGEGELHL